MKPGRDRRIGSLHQRRTIDEPNTTCQVHHTPLDDLRRCPQCASEAAMAIYGSCTTCGAPRRPTHREDDAGTHHYGWECSRSPGHVCDGAALLADLDIDIRPLGTWVCQACDYQSSDYASMTGHEHNRHGGAQTCWLASEIEEATR